MALEDADISVTYDAGPGTGSTAACPAGTTIDPSTVSGGDRIVVTVTKTFESGMPFLGSFLDGIEISSTDRRSIFKS